MNLRWPGFERSLRRRIRAAVRASKPLWQDYYQARKARRRNAVVRPWVGRLMFIAFGLAALLQTRSAQLLVPFMVLWTLGTMCLRASQLGHALYASPNLNVFHFLPIADVDIFRVQCREWLRLLGWSAADFTMLYSILLYGSHAGPMILLAGTAFGLIHSFFIGAAGLCLHAYGPRRLFGLAATLLNGAAFALVLFGVWFSRIWSWPAALATWVPPLGWALYAMGITPSHGLVAVLWPCALSGLLLALAPMVYRRLRDQYVLDEKAFALARRLTLGADSTGLPEWAERFAQAPAEAASSLRNEEFHNGLDWASLGFVERTIGRLLTPRQRSVADFLVAGSPGWGKGVRGLIAFVLVGTLIWRLFVPQMGVQALIFLGLYFLFFSGGTWRGLLCPRAGGLQSPLYAVYPLAFWDIAAVILKVNTARFLLCAPFALGALALVLLTQGPANELGVWADVKFLGLGIALQPLLVIGLISPTTGDSQSPKVVLAALVFILGLVVSCITFMAASSAAVMAGAGIVLGLLSAGALASYGRLFNRTQFDLVPLPTKAKGQG